MGNPPQFQGRSWDIHQVLLYMVVSTPEKPEIHLEFED